MAARGDPEGQLTPRTRKRLDATTSLDGWAGLIVLAYLSVGTMVMSLAEEWSTRDALYWAISTLTTVGYGDLVPKSSAAKLFTCVYVVSGVSLVSACLGVVLGRMQARVSAIGLFSALSSSPSSSSSKSSQHAAGLLLSALGLTAIVLAGAVFASTSEGWTSLDSIYWAIITCSSVGYGDLVISSASRTAAMVYVLVGVAGFASLAAGIVRSVAEMEVERAVSAFVREGITREMIDEMDADGSRSVDRFEFLSYFLVRTGKATKADILKLNAMFSGLDRDGSGTIDFGDICAASPTTTPPSEPMSSQGSSDEHLLGGRKSAAPAREGLAARATRVVGGAYAAACSAAARLLAGVVRDVAATLHEASTPRVVDALLGAAGCGATVAAMHALDHAGVLPAKLFAAPMLGSSVILYGGQRPPPASVFVVGSVGAFLLGTGLGYAAGDGSTPALAHCLCAALMLLWFKLSSAFFVPAVVLAAFYAQHHHATHHGAPSLWSALLYFASPWLAGHAVLYMGATLTSRLRQHARVAVTLQGFKRFAGDETRLREIFERYDTSGDGFLDPPEVKLAMRCATGFELELEDCERLVRSLDVDGNGVIDFHEFQQAVDDHASLRVAT